MQKIKILGAACAFCLVFAIAVVAQEPSARDPNVDKEPATDRSTEFVAVQGAAAEGVPGGTLLIVNQQAKQSTHSFF